MSIGTPANQIEQNRGRFSTGRYAVIWPFNKNPLTKSQEKTIVQAIEGAEEGNLGEVRVHIEKRCKHDDGALGRAREKFEQLGMYETESATGVLLYVAVKDRVCAVYADEGIHTCCAETFWQEVTDKVADGFKEDCPAEGLAAAIDEIGELLREHVPGEKEAEELEPEVTVEA